MTASMRRVLAGSGLRIAEGGNANGTRLHHVLR